MSDDERLRPSYHFAPASGWINDPAGLVFHDGEWHLFYQYNPDLAIWGNIHWGHAVSDDLLRWKVLAPALKPHATLGMVFTGSAVVDSQNSSGLCHDGKACITALFTHAMGQDGKQKQSLAHSDDRGRTFTLYGKNPVISNPGLKDFRDPKVVWHRATSRWVAVVAAGDRAHIFSSSDLKKWNKLSEFGPIPAFKDRVWECPDLFSLPTDGGQGSRWVFKVDVIQGIGKPAVGFYFVGDFDGKVFTNQGPDAGRRIDLGADFYAAQTYANPPDGRAVWIAWQNSWQYALSTPTVGWRGSMTVPRELSLVTRGGETLLRQQPAQELTKLRGPCKAELPAGLQVSGEVPGLSAVRGTSLEIVAEVELGSAQQLEIALLSGVKGATLVGYQAVKQQVYIDRTNAGDSSFHQAFAARHHAPFSVTDGVLKLRIFVDRSTVEVFAGDGAVVLSDLVFPGQGHDRVQLKVLGGSAKIRIFKLYKVKPPPR